MLAKSNTFSTISASQDYVNEKLNNTSSLGIELPTENLDEPLLQIKKSLSKTTYFNQKHIKSQLQHLYEEQQKFTPKKSTKSSLSSFLKSKTSSPK